MIGGGAGVLQAVKEQDAGPLLKTIFHKFVYLIDVYEAEQHEGRTFSGAEWRFLHFGPFALVVSDRISQLAGSRAIELVAGTRSADDAAFELYSLIRPAPTLKDLGISAHTRIHVAADLKRYSHNLGRLLDYVYFKTPPMIDAKPGQILSFDSCRARPIADFKPVEMERISPEAIKKGREKLAALANRSKSQISVGPFDDVYFNGLRVLDDPELPVGTKGVARIED